MRDIMREISTWEESRYFTDSSLFYYINQMIEGMYIASHGPPLIRESQPCVCADISQFPDDTAFQSELDNFTSSKSHFL